jgi:phospholipase C
MTLTYQTIATATVTSPASSITFSSIPATYQHILIRGVLRSTAVASNTIATATFNGVTSGYSRTRGIEASTSSSTNRNSSAANMGLGALNAADIEANTFSSVSWIIPNYANSDNKHGVWHGLMNSKSITSYATHIATTSQITAPITSITINDSGGGQWAAGCVLYLIGLSS